MRWEWGRYRMVDTMSFALPPASYVPFIVVLIAVASGLSILATLWLQRRFGTRRPAGPERVVAVRSPEDLELLWRALEAHVMINVADEDSRTVAVNDSFLTATGFARNEIVGQKLRSFLISPDSATREAVEAVICKDGVWTGETTITRKDGSKFWTRTTMVGHCDKQGHLRRTVALRTDITKNKQLQAETQKKLLLDRLSDEVYVFDAEDLSLQYLNQSALAHLGWAEQDYFGRPLKDAHPDLDETAFHTRVQPLLDGKAEVLIYESVHGGRPVEINLRLDRAFDGRQRFVGVIRDLAARKQMEATKSAFVTTVSHELRTPLTSVLGALKLMASGALGELADKPRSVLAIAVRNVERLVVTINDLLDLEKFEAGKMEMRLSPTDLSRVVEEAISANTNYAAELGVQLSCIGTERPYIVEANHDRLIQVLNNLLSNAAKFSRSGETVDVELRETRSAVQIFVRDHGVGIPEEFQGRLFERFVQAGAPIEGRPNGSGLGLSITKVIVERHGGTIGFTSKPGEGSTFCVELPRTQLEQVA